MAGAIWKRYANVRKDIWDNIVRQLYAIRSAWTVVIVRRPQYARVQKGTREGIVRVVSEF